MMLIRMPGRKMRGIVGLASHMISGSQENAAARQKQDIPLAWPACNTITHLHVWLRRRSRRTAAATPAAAKGLHLYFPCCPLYLPEPNYACGRGTELQGPRASLPLKVSQLHAHSGAVNAPLRSESGADRLHMTASPHSLLSLPKTALARLDPSGCSILPGLPLPLPFLRSRRSARKVVIHAQTVLASY